MNDKTNKTEAIIRVVNAVMDGPNGCLGYRVRVYEAKTSAKGRLLWKVVETVAEGLSAAQAHEASETYARENNLEVARVGHNNDVYLPSYPKCYALLEPQFIQRLSCADLVWALRHGLPYLSEGAKAALAERVNQIKKQSGSPERERRVLLREAEIVWGPAEVRDRHLSQARVLEEAVNRVGGRAMLLDLSRVAKMEVDFLDWGEGRIDYGTLSARLVKLWKKLSQRQEELEPGPVRDMIDATLPQLRATLIWLSEQAETDTLAEVLSLPEPPQGRPMKEKQTRSEPKAVQ